MSAFLLNDTSIHNIAEFLVNYEGYFFHKSIPHHVRDIINEQGIKPNYTSPIIDTFKALKWLNLWALNSRYSENYTADALEYIKPEKHLYIDRCYDKYDRKSHITEYDRKTCFSMYKKLECFLYQCTEGKVIHNELYKDLEAIKMQFANYLIHNTREYAEAEWN